MADLAKCGRIVAPGAWCFPALVGLLLLTGCGGDDGDGPTDPPGPDTTAPAAIVDLRSSRILPTSLRLNWTAPGDDGEEGRAAEYDIRLSTSAITNDNWQDAPRLPDPPVPLPALQNERVTVNGLLPGTLYYFVVVSEDEVGNRSGISNIHTVATLDAPDATPPAPVGDLALFAVTDSSAILTWTATGDDGNVGTAAAYDMRFSRTPITEENFADITDEGIPRLSPIPRVAGTREEFEFPGLAPATVYYFALRVRDDAHNESLLSNNVMLTTLP